MATTWMNWDSNSSRLSNMITPPGGKEGGRDGGREGGIGEVSNWRGGVGVILMLGSKVVAGGHSLEGAVPSCSFDI